MDSEKIYIILKAILRTSILILNVLYAIPTYLIWMALLQPLRHWHPRLFQTIEEIGYSWLNQQVVFWCWTAGYTVSEAGDDISECINDETVIMSNHQSTGDVPLLMCVIGDERKSSLARRVYWIMDDLFRCTPFGWVSRIHGDFFIKQGRDTRPAQLRALGHHLRYVYSVLGRKWILLFPEGGFLWKRLGSSKEYAKKHGYPVLNHVTLPRMGAMHVILNELSPSCCKQLNGTHLENGGPTFRPKPLKWVIDSTICYPGGRPLNFFCVLFAHRPPCTTVIHYRRYRADDLPHDHDELMQWLYDRWTEKDKLLQAFYASTTCTSGDTAAPALGPERLLSISPVKCILINVACMASTYFHLRLIGWAAEILSHIFG